MHSSVNGLDSLKGTLDLSTFFNGIHYRRIDNSTNFQYRRHSVSAMKLTLCVIKNFVVIKIIFFITEQLNVNQLVSCMFIKLSIFTI